MTGECLELLMRYDWPGNVRELENVIERAVVLSRGEPITPSHLPPKLLASKPPESPLVELPEEGIRLEELERSLIEKALEKAGGNRARAARLLGISRPTLIYRIEKYGMGGEERENEDEAMEK
jgi:two-component system NtrC family response regulator